MSYYDEIILADPKAFKMYPLPGDITSNPNLYGNPGFETNTTGWSVNATGGTLTRDTTQFYTGVASGKFVGDGSVTFQGIFNNPSITASPSTSYTAKVWMKGAVGGEVLTLSLRKSPTPTAIAGGSITLTNYWKEYTVTGTTTADATGVYLFIYTSTTIAQTWFIDSVHVGLTDPAFGNEIPIIDTQFGSYDFSAAYSHTTNEFFTAGREDKQFSLEVWTDVSTIRIGHTSDGITIAPEKITVTFTGFTQSVELQKQESKHVVLTYSPEALLVYVNGEPVIDVDPEGHTFAAETQISIHKISTTARYDGLAIYNRNLLEAEVKSHYEIGRSVDTFAEEGRFQIDQWIPDDTYLQSANFVFDTVDEWSTAKVENIFVGDTLTSKIENGFTLEGDWAVSIPLDLYDNVYSIKVQWEGTPNVVVESTYGGTTYPTTNTAVFVPFVGGVPTAESTFDLNVSFPATQVCELRSLSIIVYTGNTVLGLAERTATLTNVKLPDRAYQPNDFSPFAGAKIIGSIVLGAATEAVKEIYMFVKPTSTGTILTVNGITLSDQMVVAGAATVVASNAVNGWRYVKLTLTTPTTAAITIQRCDLISIGTSPEEKMFLNVNTLFANEQLVVNDLGTCSLNDLAPLVYSNDWAFTGAGG